MLSWLLVAVVMAAVTVTREAWLTPQPGVDERSASCWAWW